MSSPRELGPINSLSFWSPEGHGVAQWHATESQSFSHCNRAVFQPVGACHFSRVELPLLDVKARVALSDWDDAISHNVQNWAWSLQSALSDLGYAFHIDRHRLFPLEITAIMERHDARAAQCWDACDVSPRTCDTDGAALCKFHRWIALPKDASFNPFFRLPLRLAQVYQVVRFRMGCHDKLPINDHDVPRAERMCLQCDQHALGDEYHMLFECSATAAARAPYAHLFSLGCTLLEFMRHDDTQGVALCVLACLKVLPPKPGAP